MFGGMKTPRSGVAHAAILFGLVMAFSACTSKASTPDNSPVKTEVQNTQPTGTVSGEVRDVATGNGLDGVVVSLLLGATSPQPFTTLAEGAWTFADVPAGGSLGLVFKKAGYHDVRLTVQLDDSAGNFPSSTNTVFVGPVHMVHYGDTPLKVEVIRQDGTAAASIPVFLDLPAAYFVLESGDLVAHGAVHEMITTDANGLGQFASMPDPRALATRFPSLKAVLTVGAVPATTLDPGSAGETRELALTSLITGDAVQRFVLQPQGELGALSVVASTLLDLRPGDRPLIPGTVLPGVSMMRTSVIRVVFNQPVALPSVEATLVTETGESLAGSGMVTRMAVWRPSDTTAPMPITGVGTTVDLLVPALSPGIEANLLLNASSARGSAVYSKAVPVYVRADAAVAVVSLRQLGMSTADHLLGSDEDVEVLLNQAVGGRNATGLAAAAADFQNIVVQFTQPGSVARMECNLAEPTPITPYVLGGFTTRLHCTLPSGLASGFQAGAANTVSVRVDFNDAADRDGGSSNPGRIPVVTPEGVALETATGTAVLTLLSTDL
jgi:hypothetical protein